LIGILINTPIIDLVQSTPFQLLRLLIGERLSIKPPSMPKTGIISQSRTLSLLTTTLRRDIQVGAEAILLQVSRKVKRSRW
jgi:hypothetical protein